jgi:hypothetical protein
MSQLHLQLTQIIAKHTEKFSIILINETFISCKHFQVSVLLNVFVRKSPLHLLVSRICMGLVVRMSRHYLLAALLSSWSLDSFFYMMAGKFCLSNLSCYRLLLSLCFIQIYLYFVRTIFLM